MASRSKHNHKRHTHADGTPREFVPGSTPSFKRPVKRRVYAHRAPCLDTNGDPKDSPARHVHPRSKRVAADRMSAPNATRGAFYNPRMAGA